MQAPLILIVDDNLTNLKVFSQILTTEGYQVAIATSGEEALENVREELPDLILLDVMMSEGIDGFETCCRLKANPATRDIPVIFMSALSETINKVKGLSLGAVDYVTKPFEKADVLARVKVHLRLQKAQKQIIAQEKLASLGILTAGVAHELRNPLNFVNNYAEASIESIDDLLAELDTNGEVEGETLREVLANLRADAVAIHTHGQRAEHVISSMLQLARTDSKVTPQLTDIHSLLDQAVQLAYYAFRAKHQGFCIQIVKDYENSSEQIRAITTDLNRAFINLIDNACYALRYKQQHQDSHALDFIPTLKLITRYSGKAVEIRIRDNGTGIAPKLASKVYNPFFTTKPPGEGTGLGLSMTYDIIVGQHGGALTLETELGQYTEFIITLPCRRPKQQS